MATTQNIFKEPVVFNIGYQGYDLTSFISALKAAGIDRLVDLRERPVSRKKGFSRRQLESALKAEGIAYSWMGRLLGGFSIPKETWRIGCKQMADMAQSETIVMMCMEANVKECHRRQLADILAIEYEIHNINL